ncbi:MAG: phenylalanine--tRNA ligase subunit alpha, partial [Acidobacteriales bacterium]|nr:phenylalanine--tRNA ligase subunit alpha [Terriglobales bacterium]
MPYTVPKLKDFSAKALDSAVEKLLSALEKESATLTDDTQRKAFRDRWLARKDGILTQVNDLWLKPAPKEAKREVGQRVNKLKAEVEHKIETALNAAPAQTAE